MSSSDPVAIAMVSRRRIYDAAGTLVAYEVRPRQPAPVAEQLFGEILDEVPVRALGVGHPVVAPPPAGLLDGERSLPADSAELLVSAQLSDFVDPGSRDELDRVSRRGHRVALDRWDGSEAAAEVLAQVSLVSLALGGPAPGPTVSPADLPDLVKRAREANPTLDVLVTGITDAEGLAAARAAEATWLAGPGTKPRHPGKPEIQPSEAVCLRVIGALAEGASMADIERMVSSDPTLPVRILAMASSAAATARSISSLRQALVLLGPKRLSEWVLLALLSGSRKASSDVIVPMLTRSRVSEQLASSEKDVAYTAGLLSAIAEVVGADPETTLRAAHANDHIARALLDGAGPAGRAVAAVVAYEDDDPEGIAAQRLDPAEVSRVYLGGLREAVSTASSLDG